MSEFVRPDVIHTVQVANGELLVSPSHDFIHRFQRIGAYIMKYILTDGTNQKVCNVVLSKEQAQYLVDTCDLEILDREYMGTQEHEHYLEWSVSDIDDFKNMFDDPEL